MFALLIVPMKKLNFAKCSCSFTMTTLYSLLAQRVGRWKYLFFYRSYYINILHVIHLLCVCFVCFFFNLIIIITIIIICQCLSIRFHYISLCLYSLLIVIQSVTFIFFKRYFLYLIPDLCSFKFDYKKRMYFDLYHKY